MGYITQEDCDKQYPPLLNSVKINADAIIFLNWLKENNQVNVFLNWSLTGSTGNHVNVFLNWLLTSNRGDSYLGRAVNKCRHLLASLSVKNLKFKFVKRLLNKIAYYLARYNYFISDRIWRVRNVHPNLFRVLMNNLHD